jgi:hypothetical protein
MLTITAPHAVKVSGLLLNAHSEPRTGVRLYQLDSACDTQSNDVGQFQLAGIRPNADTDIIFNAFPDGSRNILHLTASQTASDFNMGSLIVSAPPTPDSVVHFALTHVADLLPDISTKDTGISLISTDFQHLFAFGVNADGSVKPARGMTATKVIAGTYFVVSGFPQDNQELGKVIRMLRAGKASVLQAASVASVTATADHDTNVTVDVAANETAVRAVQE